MNAPAKITHRWNAKSGVSHCETCEGHGEVSNGRGQGGNDPDSWKVPCPDCHGQPVDPCPVCGFNVQVKGFDCLACSTVSELADDQLGPKVAMALCQSILEAMQERRADKGEG